MPSCLKVVLTLGAVLCVLVPAWPGEVDARTRVSLRVGAAIAGSHGYLAFGTPIPVFAPVPRWGWRAGAWWRPHRDWRVGVGLRAPGVYGEWRPYPREPRWYRFDRHRRPRYGGGFYRPGYGYAFRYDGGSWFDGYRPRVWVPGRSTPEGYVPGYWEFR